jgi:hypothetical protein
MHVQSCKNLLLHRCLTFTFGTLDFFSCGPFLRFLEIWITRDSMVQINVECCVFVLLGRVIVSFMWNWDSMVQIIVECCVFVLLGRVIMSFMWNWDHSLTFSADGGDPKNKKKTI